jgi:UDP-2,4-diacetamido-2,4,6-trideoxy-beta-L-altropyranose hydrolase
MSSVLFRADSGPGIGLGHLHRSLALAASLKDFGVESIFLINEHALSHDIVRQHGWPVLSLTSVESSTAADTKSTLDAAAIHGCDAVVVDFHEAGTLYLARLREAGQYVIARDDLALYSFPCQMVFNGNADAERLPYFSSSGDTSFLLGTHYLVVKREFWKMPKRSPSTNVRSILVILGGTDQYDLMPKILNILDSLPGDFTVEAVVGPFFHNIQEVQAVAGNANRAINLVFNPSVVDKLMLEADLAISAAGQTLYELAATGCPTIAVAVANNQKGQLQALAEAGTVISTGSVCGEGDIVTTISNALDSLLLDADARSAMAVAGQNMVDGSGGQQVAEAILSAIG